MSRSFIRKIIYFSLIGLLLLPLHLLSRPAIVRKEGDLPSEGGVLAERRQRYHLSEANLGKIDPTSATMKLSTLGLHGLASTLLWNTVVEAKDREDWTTFEAALAQIKNLQPHYVGVWKYQAWNVSFNVACEFDDYRYRYDHAIQGIEMLEQGARYNDCNVEILRDLAHSISFKMGRSDESDLFRPMFRNDMDFHNPDPKMDRMKGTRYAGRQVRRPQDRDSWVVSKWWYQWVDKLLDEKLAPYKNLTRVIVHMDTPLNQIQYAKSLEDDGQFDAESLNEWVLAQKELDFYGHRRFLQTNGGTVSMDEYDDQRKEAADLQRQFEQLIAQRPGLPETLERERRAALSEEERALLAKPEKALSGTERQQVYRIGQKVQVTPRDLALAMPAEKREDAVKLVDRYLAAKKRQREIEVNREEVNYAYWKIRCEVEQLPMTQNARKAVYDGDKAFDAADLKLALKYYTTAIGGWKKVIDAHPRLLDEEGMIRDLMQVIKKYQRILAQNNKKLPEPFDLQIVLDRQKQSSAPAAGPAEPAGR